jgi:hypothetical protein
VQPISKRCLVALKAVPYCPYNYVVSAFLSLPSSNDSPTRTSQLEDYSKLLLHNSEKLLGLGHHVYNMSNMKGGNFAHDNMSPPPAGDGLVMPLFLLKGKTAIVSGAGAGIGLAIAHAYAEAGANVAIWYNSNKRALDEAANIEKKFKVKCEL